MVDAAVEAVVEGVVEVVAARVVDSPDEVVEVARVDVIGLEVAAAEDVVVVDAEGIVWFTPPLMAYRVILTLEGSSLYTCHVKLQTMDQVSAIILRTYHSIG